MGPIKWEMMVQTFLAIKMLLHNMQWKKINIRVGELKTKKNIYFQYVVVIDLRIIIVEFVLTKKLSCNCHIYLIDLSLVTWKI